MPRAPYAGQWDTSSQLWEGLLDKHRVTGGPAQLGIMHRLACDYAYLGRFPESIALNEKILAAMKAQSSPNHAELAWLLMTFGITCQRAKDFDRADRLLREAAGALPQASGLLPRGGNRDCARFLGPESVLATAVRRGRAGHPGGSLFFR